MGPCFTSISFAPNAIKGSVKRGGALMKRVADQPNNLPHEDGKPDLSVAFSAASLSSRAGGLAASLPATVNALSEAGVDVRVFGLADDALDLAALPYKHAPVHALASWPTPAIRFAPALDRALRSDPADVLHLQGLWLYPSIAALRWRRRTGRPVVVSAHGMLDPWALGNSAWKKRLALALFEYKNLEGAACIHALNHGELSAVRSIGLNVPVAVIPNGVYLPEANVTFEKPGCLAGEDRRVLLFLGRIHPKKGLSETLAAWALLLSAEPTLVRDWVLVLAGWDDGRHVPRLQQQAAELGLGQSVRFTGPVFGEEKDRLLARSDAFILASHSEGQPMAVLEAWSHGVPVFMTRACNLPEGFDEGAAVEIPTDPVAMASILAVALHNPSLQRLGVAGRELVARNFAWSSVARDLAAVYRWTAGLGPRPSCVELQ
jgi:glycosyltransferase involved in cell wall biosynthesis